MATPIKISRETYLNHQFGVVTVIDCVEAPDGVRNKGGKWLCMCVCGKEIIRSGYVLSCTRNSTNNGCGCQEHRVAVTPEQIEAMVKRYAEGDDLTTIAEAFGFKRNWVWTTLCKRGVAMRTNSECHRTLRVKEDAFEVRGEITEEQAYWAGFLMADGCVGQVSDNGFSIALGLAICDKPHVERFRDFVCPDAPVSIMKHGTSAAVRVKSKKMADDLAKFGIVPRKSLIAKATDIVRFNKHFWRGEIDGDGSVKKDDGYYKVMLCGSGDLMNQFIEFCGTVIEGFVPKRAANRRIFRVDIAGIKAVLMMERLYDRCSVALPRKQEVAKYAIIDKPELMAAVSHKPLIYAPQHA